MSPVQARSGFADTASSVRPGQRGVRSWWLQEALANDAARPEPLRGDLQTDVCIVGGGFTGLWTALRIKELEPAADVTIIERDICGGGASGRNGGFCMTWTSKVALLLPLCGGQETVRLVRESEHAVRAIGAFCDEHGIDAHFRRDGWLWTATSEAQRDAWRSTLETLDRLGLHPYEELSSEEVSRRTGSERHIAGVFEAGTATLQPALLARGLYRVCLERGVRIHENTSMLALERMMSPAVRTPQGTIRAGKVVLALNAWAHELPEFRRKVLPICADGIVTDAIPERLAALGLADGVAISDSRAMVDYYRTTVDGRIAYGKGGGAFPFAGRVGSLYDTSAVRVTEVRAAMLRNYPGLADVKVASTWRGPATRTITGLPMFGRMTQAPTIVYGHGYVGNGVGPSYTGGRILASLALDRQDEWSACPLIGADAPDFPPEPIRYVGGRLVRAAVRRKDRADDEGRRPNPLDRFLVRFAPSGLTPTELTEYAEES